MVASAFPPDFKMWGPVPAIYAATEYLSVASGLGTGCVGGALKLSVLLGSPSYLMAAQSEFELGRCQCISVAGSDLHDPNLQYDGGKYYSQRGATIFYTTIAVSDNNSMHSLGRCPHTPHIL